MSGPAPSGPALTVLGERLDRIEQQLRGITGKVEELQFNQQQQQQNQDNQLGDMTRRLQDIEVRLNASGVGAAPVAATETAPPQIASSTSVGPGGATTTTTSVTTQTTTPDPEPITKTTTEPAPSQAPVPVTVDGTAPDGQTPLAAAPTVKPLGSMKTDGTAQPGTPEAAYEAAFALLKGQKYAEAETAFRDFVKNNPRHDLAGNAQYWLGESLYARKDFKEAAKAFAEGYQKYRRAPKAADNLLKLALSLQALGNKDDACVTYAQFKKEYPDASAALKSRADSETKKLACSA